MLTLVIAMRLPLVFINAQVERRLKMLLVLSTAFQTPACFFMGYVFLPKNFIIEAREVTDFETSVCVILGLWCGALIGVVTEYYTSHTYEPVREISE